METPHEFVHLEYGLDAVPQKSGDYSNFGVLTNYDGRKYPIVEHSEFNGITKNLGFFIKIRPELDKIKELIDSRKTLIYRDNDGENIIGSILGLQYSKNILGYVIGFTINKTEV